jgi:hypothetical protein
VVQNERVQGKHYHVHVFVVIHKISKIANSLYRTDCYELIVLLQSYPGKMIFRNESIIETLDPDSEMVYIEAKIAKVK